MFAYSKLTNLKFAEILLCRILMNMTTDVTKEVDYVAVVYGALKNHAHRIKSSGPLLLPQENIYREKVYLGVSMKHDCETQRPVLNVQLSTPIVKIYEFL